MSKFLVLDIESANTLEQPFAYDVGFAVCDKKEILKEFSFLVYEIFVREPHLMNTAYYSEKIPLYDEKVRNGEIEIATLSAIRKTILEVIEEYKITDVYAYNASFDIGGLNTTLRYITKSAQRYFFPAGTKFKCIHHMSAQTLFRQKTYKKFANEHNLKSKRGYFSTSAESAYKYITLDPTFEEAHTGLDDVKIEYEILKKVFRQKKRVDTGINRDAWRIPQRA